MTAPGGVGRAEQAPQWRGRWVLYVLGVAAIAYGALELAGAAERTRPIWAAVWFGGGVVAHDAVLVPAVLLIAAAVVRWVPRPVRTVVQGALFVSGAVVLVAFPLAGGFGGGAGNPSANPLPYGRNLLLVLAAVWAASAVLVACNALRGRRRRQQGPARGR